MVRCRGNQLGFKWVRGLRLRGFQISGIDCVELCSESFINFMREKSASQQVALDSSFVSICLREGCKLYKKTFFLCYPSVSWENTRAWLSERLTPGGEVWVWDLARSLCCVIGQNTFFSQCLTPPRNVNEYQGIVREDWWNAGGVTLQWTGVPSREE